MLDAIDKVASLMQDKEKMLSMMIMEKTEDMQDETTYTRGISNLALGGIREDFGREKYPS